MKTTKFSTVVAKSTLWTSWFLKCWWKFRVTVKTFHISKN